MSTNPTTQQTDVSGTVFVAALPQWKRALWRDISVAARARNAFGNDDYDGNGDLKPHSARFAELCTWLVCLTHFDPAVRKKHEKKFSRADENVGRLSDVLERHLRD